MGNKSILLIYTGGTIGMKMNPETGALAPFDFSQIGSEVPELRKFGVEIETVTFEPPIDSSNVDPRMWSRLAVLIGQRYENYDGFVVLHGTDTMAYTASALSFMLEHLGKPVIFTGSQIPIGVLRTDGRENLISAIEIAAQARVGEVAIYFQNRLLRANRTIKYSSEQLDAFRSPNFPALAQAGIQIHYQRVDPPDTSKPLTVHTSLETAIAVVRIFPGFHPRLFSAIMAAESLKGIVLQTYGSGNAPTDKVFLGAVRDAIRRGVVVVNVTQCFIGTVDMSIYETGRELMHAGVFSAGDMTTEAALTKLMFLLGGNFSQEQIRTAMTSSLRGEMTVEHRD